MRTSLASLSALSFMCCYNSVHLCSAEAKASTAQVKKTLGNQVIRKGWLTMYGRGFVRGGSQDFWFVLTSDSLSWFKDDEVAFFTLVLLQKFYLLYRKRRRSTCCRWTVSSCVTLRLALCRARTNSPSSTPTLSKLSPYSQLCVRVCGCTLTNPESS